MHELLNSSFPDQNQALVNEIVHAAQPEKIFLLGATCWRRRTESLFANPSPSAHSLTNFILLVLVSEKHNRTRNEIQDKIEQHCSAAGKITAIVLTTVQFSDMLTEGHRFATTVLKMTVIM